MPPTGRWQCELIFYMIVWGVFTMRGQISDGVVERLVIGWLVVALLIAGLSGQLEGSTLGVAVCC